jgi:hypothetical protein
MRAVKRGIPAPATLKEKGHSPNPLAERAPEQGFQKTGSGNLGE